MKKSKLLVVALMLISSFSAGAALNIKEAEGWFESGYVTWDLMSDAKTYNVYYRENGGAYIQLDHQLVRNYGSYGRADVLGIAAGDYQFKVIPVDVSLNEMNSEMAVSDVFSVREHNRDGFAHFNHTEGIGAYKDNGELKDNAKVLYITSETAKTVSTDIIVDSKGKTMTYTGFQNIIDGYQKGYDNTPIAFRIIGTLHENDMDKFSSSAEGLQIKGNKAYSTMNLTIEGVGNDATIYSFGILLRNCKSVELRNFAIMLCWDDCLSLDTDNSNIWVHNIDFFYGKKGSASDQVKGDGSLDLKGNSKYLTLSYNHFWDSGKMSLCGMKSESGENFISYHHNWFDRSDSRHPRVRTMTVHVFNNYYDGNSKYGVGACMGSNIFVENNYFRNTSRPMMSSKQGTDATGDGTFSGENGGMIKSFGNHFTEKSSSFSLITHKQSAKSFDCYEADSRDELVPSTFKTIAGGTVYNNFDTDTSKMYKYTPDAAEDVRDIVISDAGRMHGGDFIWNFTAADDNSYALNDPLKLAITNYTGGLVSIFDKAPGYGTSIDNTLQEQQQGDNIIYDLTGRKVVNPGKGVYIRNGKKFMIR